MEAPIANRFQLGGRYRLGPRLGQGGMAEVYEAYDERLARPVAVKLLRPELAVQADARRRFEAEARAAARLSHPNVVAVHDTGEQDGRAYIVMERLPGETLADRIAAGPVDQGWLWQVALEVLAALGAAHAAGIIHRDIKPANILLAVDGGTKVADFGIAKTIQPTADLTATGMVIGTPAYLAPELVDGHAAGPQADLYSLGVVMYEALTGRKPFGGTTPLAVAYRIRHESPPDPRQFRADTDPRAVAVIGQAMAPWPAARFASAAAMANAIASLAGVKPVLLGAPDHPYATVRPNPHDAAPTTRLPERHRSAIRSRWPAVLTGALAIAITVSLLLVGLTRVGHPVARHTAGPTATTVTGTSPSTATTPSTSGPTTTPTTEPGVALAAFARSLTRADGSAFGVLQSGLDQVAALPPGGPQAAAATSLLARVCDWYSHDQLSTSAYGGAVSLLTQLGGTLPATGNSNGNGGGHQGGSGGRGGGD